MICLNCKEEKYRYKIFYLNGQRLERCFSCANSNLINVYPTEKRLLDVNENLWMSPAEYRDITTRYIAKNGEVFNDKKGRITNNRSYKEYINGK